MPLTNPSAPRPSESLGKPSQLTRDLIKAGCTPPEGFKSVREIMDERDELLVLMAEMIGSTDGFFTIAMPSTLRDRARALIARCEAS